MKICKKCKSKNNNENKFCSVCGTNIEDVDSEEEVVVCSVCGGMKKNNYRFCIYCGSFFKDQKPKENLESDVQIITTQTQEKENTEVNSLAQLSFLLGIISLCSIILPLGVPFSVVLSLFGLATGIIAIIRKPNILRKKSIQGIIISTTVFVISITIFCVAGPILDIIIAYFQNYSSMNSL